MKIPLNKHELIFEKSITRWDEAVPLGNGRLGCLIWGEPEEFHISLDRGDIWDISPPCGTDKPEFTYANLVKLAREKQTEKIREIFDAPYYNPLPTKLPAGRIVIRMKRGSNIRSRLLLKEARAEFSVEGRGALFHMEGYVHAVEQFGYFRVGLPDTETEITLVNPEFGSLEEAYCYKYDQEAREISQGSLKQLKYKRPEKGEKKFSGDCRVLWFSQEVSGGFCYGVVLGIRKWKGGQHLFYKVASSGDGFHWLEDAIEAVRALMTRDVRSIYPAHRQWWQEFWEKSHISLPEPGIERLWYLANYFLASCSRKGGYPMALQGVWTAAEDILPPWKGDYHNDLNTQMSYYHYLKANHLKEGECFLDYLWELREAGQRFARDFYGTKGLCLPAVMTIDGQPLGGWPMYSLSPVNQIWLGWLFERYYRYTKDEKFLRERACPYLTEIGECICGLLEPGEDGMLRLPVSSSPEIHDDTAEAFVTPNSNYDLALMRFLFQTLIEFSSLVGDGREKAWRSVCDRLPVLSVDADGVLMISPDERLNESHRHFSNAMAVHPLRRLSYQSSEDKRIIDASVSDFERLGTDNWTGFSFCWMAELYAVQGNGEKAAEELRIFQEAFCSPNGFHLNGDYKKLGYSHFTYRPFTLEANMCAADVIQEMLLYAEDGVLEPFPAIPAAWELEGTAFSGLRGAGNILVSARVEQGRLCELYIDAEEQAKIILRGWDEEGYRKREIQREICLMQGRNTVF